MKVNRNINRTHNAASLSVTVQYNVADIKSALLRVSRECSSGTVGISMSDLVRMLYDTATDDHMPSAPRQYIAEWMARMALHDGFVFKADKYIGEANTDTYIIDVSSIGDKMRGRPKKTKA